MVEENIKYQQLQKICREKVCGMKVFRVNLGKIAPQKLPAHTPMVFRELFENRQALRIRMETLVELSTSFLISFSVQVADRCCSKSARISGVLVEFANCFVSQGCTCLCVATKMTSSCKVFEICELGFGVALQMRSFLIIWLVLSISLSFSC